MPPQQHPPAPQGPQQPVSPQAPHIGYGTPDSQHFQQHPSGHYEVLPTLPPGQNNGRTGHNPYDFIVNPNTSGVKLGFMNGGGFLKRIMLLVAGLVVVCIVIAIALSALTPKSSTPGIVSIAERQQEIIRVSTAAAQLTSSQDAQNFVANVQVSMTSSQQKVLAYLTAHGKKLSTSDLAIDHSSQTDTTLANAATANNYDSAVAQNLDEQLQTYESLLQTTYKQTTSPPVRAMLQADFNGAALLLKQATRLSAELNAPTPQ